MRTQRIYSTPKNRNWEKIYNTYKKNYFKKSAKSDVSMESLYNFRTFRMLYEALEQDRLEEREQGLRKSSLNVTRDMILKQVKYKESLLKARQTVKIYDEWYKWLTPDRKEKYIPKITIMQARKGTVNLKDMWDDIDDLYKEKGEEYVGQTFISS